MSDSLPSDLGRDPRPSDPFKATLQDLLVVLVKRALVDDAEQAGTWDRDGASFKRRLAELPRPASLKLDGIWANALKIAIRDPVVRRGETANPTLPMSCPLGFEDLASGDLDLASAAQTIRESSSTG